MALLFCFIDLKFGTILLMLPKRIGKICTSKVLLDKKQFYLYNAHGKGNFTIGAKCWIVRPQNAPATICFFLMGIPLGKTYK